MTGQKKEVEFETINDPDFKILSLDGFFGVLNANGGRMAVYMDSPVLETNKDGQMTVTAVKRTILIELRMSTEVYKSTAEWMKNNIEAYEKSVKTGTGIKPIESTQPYYG
jgi:hypothetical protein